MTRVLALAIPIAMIGALLAGCGTGPAVDKPTPHGGATSTATPTPGATLQAAPTEQASPFAAVDPADFRSQYGGGVEFDSPSLNIQCGIFPDPGYGFFACSIDEYDYADPPPTPEQLACSQNISYGGGFIAPLDGSTPVEVLCRGGAGEWEIDPHPVLQYGSSITHGGVVCESTSDHMGCRSLDTGHGFTLSRNSYTMF